MLDFELLFFTASVVATGVWSVASMRIEVRALVSTVNRHAAQLERLEETVISVLLRFPSSSKPAPRTQDTSPPAGFLPGKPGRSSP